ncbi:Cytochrome P450 CYP2 subfamily [Handroanthus impetiginosus]|uniref:Cytochrome P450 CYP2 subfamily n=1 Tax=Handroanthus impetiginosus TaxID=429701 RepID=A0A2G9H8F4_9LAMI|nr:Cytochrome P450 CYP2 subfamily [Handroanthus impetiginosus]
MAVCMTTKDSSWWVYTLPAFLGPKTLLDEYIIFSILLAFFSLALLTWAFSPGGTAWKNGRTKGGASAIPGPRGLPFFGSLFTLSLGLPHRSLASIASSMNAKQLMAFSLGSTPAVVASDPQLAKEILTSPHFANRPIKQSARSLMFSRAMGFAPNGTHWRLLRRIAASHLFAPRRIAAHEPGRQKDCAAMLNDIAYEQSLNSAVSLRKHIQLAALINIMGSVFGKRYDPTEDGDELRELKEMVREGFELLGAFNWSDYLPWLSYVYDPCRILSRCEALVPRVRRFVKGIIEQHKVKILDNNVSDNADFVDVLLSLEGDEKLDEDDMIAVLWEMIFRGTDTTALLTEWVMAELVLHPEVQSKLREEIDIAAGKNAALTDADVAALPYLQAVLKETLRIHPPGPLLSWARLSTSDVHLSNGMVVPAATTAMVNMWAITHDSSVWDDPLEFKPERFVAAMGGADVDVRGGDLRLAPFGAGRRVCPGKNLGMVTVALWVAKLVRHFNWAEDKENPVDLSEVLKLSCEMKYPLSAVAENRSVPF